MRQTILLIAAVALVGCGKKTSPAELETKAKPKVAAKKPELSKTEPKKISASTTKIAQCEFCGKKFPATNIRGHELKCAQNGTGKSSKPINNTDSNSGGAKKKR